MKTTEKYQINTNPNTWIWKIFDIQNEKNEVRTELSCFRPIRLEEGNTYIDENNEIYNLTGFGFFWSLGYETTRYKEYLKMK